MKNISRIFTAIFILLIAGFVITNAQSLTQNKNSPSDFRYVIAFNDVNKKCEKCTEDTRSLIVLMEKPSFTEENLKKLYMLLTKRFPVSKHLIVVVETDIAEIPTPEERELGTFGFLKPKTPWAMMHHNRELKVFRIDMYTESKEISTDMPQ